MATTEVSKAPLIVQLAIDHVRSALREKIRQAVEYEVERTIAEVLSHAAAHITASAERLLDEDITRIRVVVEQKLPEITACPPSRK